MLCLTAHYHSDLATVAGEKMYAANCSLLSHIARKYMAKNNVLILTTTTVHDSDG